MRIGQSGKPQANRKITRRKTLKLLAASSAEVGRAMRFEKFSFGSIRIDGVTHEHDVVIDRGTVRKRKKKASNNSVTPLGTRRCPWRKRSPGNAAGS